MLEHGYPQSEPEDVHKIYAVAEFRHFCYDPRRIRAVDACEHKERARSENHTVDSAESPSYFYYGGGKRFSGYSLDIE